MRIAVTGSTGFIGGYLARALAEVSRQLGVESGAQRWEAQARRLAP